jgi:cobalt transporter subunit CbtB
MTTQTNLYPNIQTAVTHKLAAISVIFLGLALILAVGFTPLEVVHNATHDNRHATGFPCH